MSSLTPRILQICGRAPSARQVPPDLPNAERWIIGACYREHVGTRYDAVFDVHPLEPTEWHPGILALRPDAWAWYGAQDTPVYLIAPHADVPSSRAYPRSLIGERFGDRAACAISSSVDQMLALGLLRGFAEIHLCGIRMISVEEWVTQRECLAYWIGLAEGLGVVVHTDPVAALCAPERVYGWGDPTGAVRAPGQPALVLAMSGQVE